MARAKKETFKYISRDERPEFIAAVADLPDAPAELEALAEQYQRTFNAAVLAGHLDVLKAQHDALAAVATKLNGGVARGALGDDAPLAAIIARKAPPLGQVPLWGQDGEFLLEVEGIRIRVRARSSSLNVVLHVDLNVVDLDQLFVSETGYRSTYIWADRSLGLTVDQAVRRDVEQMLAAKGGKPRMVEPNAFIRQRWEGVPTWLADLLAGVKADGQLLMGFGDTPKDPNDKVPMSNKARQKAFRQRQREKREALKAEGLHALELSGVDLARLFIALDTHMSFNNLLDWDLQDYLELAGRLFKGEDNAEAKVQCLGGSIGVANYKKQLEANAKRGFKAYEEEREVSKRLRERLGEEQAEKRQLQQALQAIAYEVSGTPAPVGSMGYSPASAAKLDAELKRLRAAVEELELGGARASAEIYALKKENAQLESERNKAHGAIKTWEDRLRAAGQSTDYRKQPGE